jgi:exonuclease III
VLRSLVILATFISFQNHLLANDRDYLVPVARNEIKIMSYNVQNLFDAEHDRGKADYEFLPKSHPQKVNCYSGSDRKGDRCASLDWTEEKVEMKIASLKRVIAAQGPLPDILVLTEMENKDVAGRLAEALGFDSFSMTNSPDNRGIDVAVMFRKNKLTAKRYNEREVQGLNFATRNLSFMLFQLSDALGGGMLAIFPSHWPSQSPSNGNGRIVVARELRQYVDEMREYYAQRKQSFSFIVTGDFNCVDDENPHPIDSIILDRRWDVRMSDVREMARRAKHPLLSKMPKATYYYGPEDAWNEFDRFFVDSTLADGTGLDVDPHSYRIHAPSFLTKKNDKGEAIPFRFNHYSANPNYIGYSDHFGIVMKLRYEN